MKILVFLKKNGNESLYKNGLRKIADGITSFEEVNKILEEYPAKIEAIEARIKELNHALSTPEIYQKLGMQGLFEELEEKRGTLNNMENEYYEVLSLAESLK